METKDIVHVIERMETLPDELLLSEGFTADIQTLEDTMLIKLRELKDRRDEAARKYCRDRGHDVDNYGARQVRIANSSLYITVRAPSAVKFVDGSIDSIDEKFIKVEKKLDTKAINEYKKQTGKMPEGVLEEMRGGGSVTVSRKIEKPKKVGRPAIKNPLEGVNFLKR